MRSLGVRYPESTYSPNRGSINHVRAKVSQYATLQATRTALFGNQMPADGDGSS